MRLSALAKELRGELRGSPGILIEKVSSLDDAGPGSIVYVSDPKRIASAEKSKASALLVSSSIANGKKPMVICKNSKLAFARLLTLFHAPPPQKAGIHPSAIIDKTAILETGIRIGAGAVIGPRAKIGKNVKIGSLAFIDEEVKIGDDSEIHAQAAVLRRVEVGKRCVLLEGCVIGSEGFGYATDESGKHIHIPQIGTVILEDEVEIGANSTVDRATLGVTRIGKGTKIDNLVQVAHNCVIGENCFIVAGVGIAGSAVIGAGTMIGGHSGIRDHARIGAKSIVAAATNVWGNLKPGAFVSGTPARPHKEQVKMYALMRKLPELVKRLEALEDQSPRSP